MGIWYQDRPDLLEHEKQSLGEWRESGIEVRFGFDRKERFMAKLECPVKTEDEEQAKNISFV